MQFRGISIVGSGLSYSVPASETAEGQERERAYYEALGRFVQIFAEVEKIVAQTLWAYAGTDQTVAKIVFSGMNSDNSAKCIRAIAVATTVPEETQNDLENVLQQFGIIRGARNDILHYGATSIAEGTATVSNAWKAKAEPTVFPISPISLTEMRDDCRKIIAHLGYRHLGRALPKSEAVLDVLGQVLQSAWLYKHPVQPKSDAKKEERQHVRKRGLRSPRPQRASPK